MLSIKYVCYITVAKRFIALVKILHSAMRCAYNKFQLGKLTSTLFHSVGFIARYTIEAPLGPL